MLLRDCAVRIQALDFFSGITGFFRVYGMCLFLGLGLKTLGVLQGCLGSRRLDGLLGFGCRTVWPLRFRVQGLLKSASCFRHIAHRMS